MPVTDGFIPANPQVWGYGENTGQPGTFPTQTQPSTQFNTFSEANLSRVYFSGHSYNTFDSYRIFLDYAPDNQTNPQLVRPHNNWTSILPELLGMRADVRYIQAVVGPVATAANDLSTVIGVLPSESVIEEIVYCPLADVTGANTNSRTLALRIPSSFAAATIVNFPLTAGINLKSFTGNNVAPVGVNTIANWQQAVVFPGATPSSLQYAFRDGNNVYKTPNQSSARTFGACGVILGGSVLVWDSLHVGTGITDPGGLVIIRLGNTIRNSSVTGAVTAQSGVLQGGWTTALNYRPLRACPGTEVNVTATAATSAVSIACEGLENSIGNGASIIFNNGVVAVTSASAAVGATSISVAALAAPGLPQGSQGFVAINTSPTQYEAINPTAAWFPLYGVNDLSPTMTPYDAGSYREAIRTVIAAGCCPYYSLTATQANIQYAAGNGAAAAWSASAGILPHFPNGSAQLFTGAVGATPPTITIQIAPGAMQGTTIDLFFAAMLGLARGGTASITVDGQTPPTGPVTIKTSNLTTPLTGGLHNATAIAGVNTLTCTTTNGSAVVTVTGGTFNNPKDIGRYLIGTSIPAGTFISNMGQSSDTPQFSATNTFTMSQNATAAAGAGLSLTTVPFVPMVKRITGLNPNVAHTIVITLTAMDASPGAFIFMGYGIETNNPPSMVFPMNVARIPAKALASDAQVNQINLDLYNVIMGLAPPFSGNSQEPGFNLPGYPGQVNPVDIDSAIGGQTSTMFLDSVHPNARGQQAIARAAYDALRVSTTTAQQAAR